MPRVGVIGIGHGRFGRRSDATVQELAFEAYRLAVRDAGITPDLRDPVRQVAFGPAPPGLVVRPNLLLEVFPLLFGLGVVGPGSLQVRTKLLPDRLRIDQHQGGFGLGVLRLNRSNSCNPQGYKEDGFFHF